MLMKIRKAIKRKDNEKGFTLVELIVVMAILAILAGIAVPRYEGVMTKSRQKADQATVKILNDAADMYYADNNSYPTGDAAAVITALNNGGYLRDSVYTPATGGVFSYSSGKFSKTF